MIIILKFDKKLFSSSVLSIALVGFPSDSHTDALRFTGIRSRDLWVSDSGRVQLTPFSNWNFLLIGLKNLCVISTRDSRVQCTAELTFYREDLPFGNSSLWKSLTFTISMPIGIRNRSLRYLPNLSWMDFSRRKFKLKKKSLYCKFINRHHTTDMASYNHKWPATDMFSYKKDTLHMAKC